MNIRVAIPRIPMYMEVDSSGKLTGLYGTIYSSLYEIFLKNFTPVVIEGNIPAVIDVLEQGNADILCAPIDYGSGPSFLTPTSQVGALDGAASHAPTLSVVTQDLLNTLHIYSVKVLLLLLTSILVTGVTLPILDHSYGVFESMTKVGQCLLNQSNWSPSAIKARALLLFWFIVSFVIMEVYEQAMNADMVLTDYSSIVESLEDLDRHKSYRPVFLEGEFIGEQFKQSLDPVKQSIWKRSITKELNPTAIADAGETNDVNIGMRVGVVACTEYFCGSSSEKSNNRKYLIGTKGFGVVNLAFYYRINVTKGISQFIDYNSLLVAQGGHVLRLFMKVHYHLKRLQRVFATQRKNFTTTLTL